MWSLPGKEFLKTIDNIYNINILIIHLFDLKILHQIRLQMSTD